jgi:ABC-type Na+ efflux pump permease subunit
MGSIAAILTISRWEVKKVLSVTTRAVLPISLLLMVALVLVSGFAAQSGVHLQDGIYRVGTDDPPLASLFSRDPRFSVYLVDRTTLEQQQYSFDLILFDGRVYAQRTDRAAAALKALERDYEGYVAQVYSSQEDLFAAYPLWIDQQYVQSELSFSATEGGQYLGIRPSTADPYPEGPVEVVPEPLPTLALPEGDLRQELVKTATSDDPFARYTSLVKPESGMGNVRVPSQLTPSLPFDSIIAVFIFIFPLYFLSQFFMMSIMGERLDRRGEPLLSTPLQPYQIITGKALPYFLAMVATSLVLAFGVGGSPALLIPLLPIMLFFLASALLIAMLARSFKELSFISIFFSTIVTSYLFLPTIFTHVHIVSLISPLTLVVLQLQGEPFTITEYFYSTAFFYITSAVLFFVAMMNFQEERLFGQGRFLSRIREFIGSSLSEEHPYLSLFLLNAFLIPFVFMAQLMLLVIFFNLPMPLSLILLILTAALVEEIVKSLGVYTLFRKSTAAFSFPTLLLAAGATALGFLAGEKLFLFAMLSQITESIFGSVLFLSLQVLWLPFLLHFSAVMTVGLFLKYGGTRGYAPGIFLATLLHTAYNLSILSGVVG